MAGKQITIRDYKTQVPGTLSDDGSTWLFPQINSVNSHGKKTEWRIHVRAYMGSASPTDPPTDNAFILIRNATYDLFDNATRVSIDATGALRPIYGWIKVESRIGDGPVRTSAPTYVTKGKNAKASSATTPFCQAIRDAYGLHNKQLRKAVKEAGEGVDTVRYPPMLAKVAKYEKLDFTQPIFVQPKYNGVRTVTTLGYIDGDKEQPTVIMYSRRGITYPGFDHIKKELLPILTNYWRGDMKIYLDGEMYKHGVPLQDISGAARRENTDGVAPVVTCDYMVYDCFIVDKDGNAPLIYSERKKILDALFDRYQKQLVYTKPVPTFKVPDTAAIDELYAKFLTEKYEGAMIRLDRPYKYSHNDHHSSILLKKKPTLDAEFTITRWETGLKGKAAGALMIVCVTAEGTEFPVTPAMELPDRMALTKKMSEPDPTPANPLATYFDTHYKGKPLIVYFDEKSKSGTPQRARTKMEIRTWD